MGVLRVPPPQDRAQGSLFLALFSIPSSRHLWEQSALIPELRNERRCRNSGSDPQAALAAWRQTEKMGIKPMGLPGVLDLGAEELATSICVGTAEI